MTKHKHDWKLEEADYSGNRSYWVCHCGDLKSVKLIKTLREVVEELK